MKKYKTLFTVTLLNTMIALSEYVSLAILALYLNEKVPLIRTTIIISTSTLIPAFFGSTSAVFEKVLGRKWCLLISTVLCLVWYSTIIYADNFWILIYAAILEGISKILWQPIVKTLFIDSSEVLNNRNNVHRVRYLSICVAGLIGPLLGAFISNVYKKQNCLYFSIILCIVALIIILIFVRNDSYHYEKDNLKAIFVAKKILNIKRVPVILWLYVIIGTLVFFVFVQFENTYSLYFKSYSNKPENIFSLLLILNSFFGILLQMLIMKLNFRSNRRIVLYGNIFFIVAFMIFSFSFHSNCSCIILLILAILVYSIGEVMVIPALDMIIDEIASDDNKTLYFGFAEIRNLGYVLGPVYAGVMLEITSPAIAAFSCSIILLIVNLLFVMVSKLLKITNV